MSPEVIVDLVAIRNTHPGWGAGPQAYLGARAERGKGRRSFRHRAAGEGRAAEPRRERLHAGIGAQSDPKKQYRISGESGPRPEEANS